MALAEELEREGHFLFKHRGILPVIVVLVGIAAFLENALTGEWLNRYWFNLPYELFCFFIALAGFLVRCGSIGYASMHTSGRNTKGQVAESLNTMGLYSMARHPLYFGNFLISFGAALLTRNPWFILFFIFFFWVYYERIMFAEEQFLTKKFTDTYTSWAAKTPAFIPKYSLWKGPSWSFNWKRAIWNEKAGVLAITTIFLLFAELEEFIRSSQFILHDRFWYYLFILSLIVYAGLKLIVKFSSLLDGK